MAWSTATDVESACRRRWADGTLLRAYAAGEPLPLVDVPLRGPRPSEVGADLTSVRRWIEALEQGSRRRGRLRYELVHVEIGGRHVGRNRVPGRARVTSYDQAWALLDVCGEVATYDEILAATADEPVLDAWVRSKPLAALEVGEEWPQLVAAYAWLRDARDSGRYLRTISAPGVDTKLVERHRSLLARLLGVPASATGFLRGLGLAVRPDVVRLRRAPGTLGLPDPLTELTVRVDELATLKVSVASVLVVENETTYLSLPIPVDGLVLWGKGFEVDRVGQLPWLREARVHYWGDLDTHGFAILHQLRAWLPHTESFLMDRDTLLVHRERWGTEPTPTRARLERLTAEEQALYADLVSDRYADRLRLEQERIAWPWVTAGLPYLAG